MNPIIETQIGHADPNASPLTINELIDLLNTLITTQLTGSYIPYIIQQATPGVDDRDKAWIELDSSGRPKSLKIWYAGTVAAWRRVYNGMLREIRGYSGDPSQDFDANGHGLVGENYDGWQLCNGLNGSPNLSDKFMVAGHMDNSGGHTGYGTSGWQTFVDGTTDHHTGGVASKMITEPYLPELSVTLNGFEAKEDSPVHPDIAPLVDVHYANALPHSVSVAHYGANPGGTPPVPQVAFPTLPPFIAYGLIIFQGY